jgi:hypothetical protein
MTLRVLVAAAAFALVASSPLAVAPARAEAPAPAPPYDPADALMKKLVDAVKADAYADFVADGTPRLKSISKGAFGLLSARFRPMLLQGYKTTFLAKLRKLDGTIHLWKLEPAGAKEDFEIRLVLVKDGKNAGKVDAFSIQ